MLERGFLELQRFDEYFFGSLEFTNSVYGASKTEFHLEGCACSGCQDGDKELIPGGETVPANDTVPGGLDTTETLTPGSFVRSSIDTGDDTDWFAIDLTEGETYTFTIFLNGLRDSTLTLRDSEGVEIVSNDDANVNINLLWSEITFTATTTGTYYLDVGSFGTATGEYFLSSSRPTADDVGASVDTAGSTTIGETITGVLDQTGDQDWYAVTLEAGEIYQFITSSTGGDNDVDTTLTIRDANGNVLAWNDDSTGTYSRVRLSVEESGTYYIDVRGWADSEAGDYQLTSETVVLEQFSNDQIADQLLSGYWGEGNERRWDVSEGGTLTVNITGLTEEGQFLAREALNLWSDVIGITFTEVSDDAQITFDDESDGAFASSSRSGEFIVSANINVSTAWLDNNGTTLNSYSFQTYIHEIGHALGLGHGGDYNGSGVSYSQDALYLNDSWATTVMSYFSQTRNEYFAELGFSRRFVTTPMSADIVAIQSAYGGSTTTRTGDTVYGVGNTTGREVYGVGASATDSSGNLLAFTIFDNGGVDTLNYENFSSDQLINLNEETFSNVGGSIGNMSIARGTVIENVISGSGNDQLIGNGAVNRLTGGAGNDTIDGGANVDTAVVSGNRSEYTITQTSTGVFEITGPDGTDVLTNVEFLEFDDEVLRLLPGTGVSVNFDTSDPSLYQVAMEAIRDFDGNDLGGDGFWLRIGEADVNGDGDIDQILVNDAIGRFATVGTAPDGLVYFDDHGWAGETRIAGIYIDPLVAAGEVEEGSEFDSQRRFQNDLEIENINRVLGSDDYNNDGIWEVYFALTDGTAYLRALMHEDGNIRYANYQSEEQVIEYLTENGYDESTYGDWFSSNNQSDNLFSQEDFFEADVSETGSEIAETIGGNGSGGLGLHDLPDLYSLPAGNILLAGQSLFDQQYQVEFFG